VALGAAQFSAGDRRATELSLALYPSQDPLTTGTVRPGRRTAPCRAARIDDRPPDHDRDEIRRAIVRISHEIVEKHAGTQDLALVGIQRRGVPLAHRIADAIEEHEGVRVPVGALDITFYRDDLSLVAEQPMVKGTDLPFD